MTNIDKITRSPSRLRLTDLACCTLQKTDMEIPTNKATSKSCFVLVVFTHLAQIQAHTKYVMEIPQKPWDCAVRCTNTHTAQTDEAVTRPCASCQVCRILVSPTVPMAANAMRQSRATLITPQSPRIMSLLPIVAVGHYSTLKQWLSSWIEKTMRLTKSYRKYWGISPFSVPQAPYIDSDPHLLLINRKRMCHRSPLSYGETAKGETIWELSVSIILKKTNLTIT